MAATFALGTDRFVVSTNVVVECQLISILDTGLDIQLELNKRAYYTGENDLEGRESDQQVDRQPSTVPRQMDEVFMTAGNAGLKETLRIHLNAAECVFFYCSSL
ncbi:hypothetical protein RJZ57_006293 [Blastomyces gilchristii]